jgi:hypothetical protein
LGIRELASRLRRDHGLGFDVALFCLGFALLRIWTQHGQSPVRHPDSPGYFHLDFLGHGVERLWTVPLLFLSLPTDKSRMIAQLVIGIACWSALAFAVAYSFASPVVARAGAVLVLLLGLCEQVTEWDTNVMSESLALSLLALLVASLLWLRLHPTRWWLVGTLAVIVLWVFTKQLQATLFTLIASVAIVWILLRRRRLIGVAVALAVIAAWGGYATASSGRDNIAFNANEILVWRILKTDDGGEYFAARGLPRLDELKREAAATTNMADIDQRVLGDPEWRQWVDQKWLRAYAGWLLRHPGTVIHGPLGDAATYLSGFSHDADVQPVLPGPVQDTLWARTSEGGDIPLFIGLAFVLWLASCRAPRRNHLDAFAMGMVGVAVVWYYAAWHFDVVRLDRIAVPPAAALRIGLLILGLAAVDRLLAGRAPQNG